ncbi:MAG TPA: MBG domain-containing protein [Herpetosiphonaceae bacterium]
MSHATYRNLSRVALVFGLLALLSALPQRQAAASPARAGQASPSRSVPPGACANPVVDNGTFVTNTGNGPGGADTSVLLNVSAGRTIFGFGSNAAAGFSMAENFTLTNALSPTQATFFTYQTGSTTVSTITGVGAVTLYDGPPGAGGNVIAGPVSPPISSTGFTGVYRVAENAQTGSTRPIMQVTINWPFGTLQPGAYWLQWGLTGSLASGPWTVPLGPGNARQFNGTSWAEALDGTTPMDVPLVICGEEDAGVPPTITSAAPDAGTYGAPYSHTVTASGTPTPTLALSGTLPAGLTWTAATGVIAGTPEEAGSFSITVSASNGAGAPDTEAYTVVIDKASLTVTPAAATRRVGQPDPVFTLNYSGFVLGDTAADLDTPPTATTNATPSSPPGTYSITPSGGSDDNYTFSYGEAQLTITNQLTFGPLIFK